MKRVKLKNYKEKVYVNHVQKSFFIKNKQKIKTYNIFFSNLGVTKVELH